MKVAATRQLVVKSICHTVLLPSTERSNTISQTMNTPSAIRPAAKMPQACEMALTTLMNLSIAAIRGASNAAARSLHRERLVDQLLAVGHTLGELGVGALFREIDPDVEVGVGELDDLDVMVVEQLDGRRIDAVGLAFIERLRVLSGLEDGGLLRLVELVEALLRHQHRLVHEPQRVGAGLGQALDHLVEAHRAEGGEAGVVAVEHAGVEAVVDLVRRRADDAGA